MTGTQIFGRFHSRRGVGREVARVFVECKLVDLIRPPVGDVGHEGEPVGRVGLDGVGPGCGHQPFDGGSDCGAVFYAVHPYRPLVIISGEDIPAFPVGGQGHGLAL